MTCLFVLILSFILFREVKAQTVISEWEGHNGPVNTVLFSKDGLKIISVGDDGTIRFFNTSDNSLQKIIISKNSSVKRLILSDDGTKFAVNGDNNYIEIYSYPAGDLLISFIDSCRSICFSGDGRKIFSCGDNLKIWDAVTGTKLKTVSAPVSNYIIMTKDQTKVLLAGQDSKIYLFDYNSNQTIRIYDEHIMAILCLSLSPDGTKFASSSADRTIRIWDINSSTSLKLGFAHLGYVYSIAYSNDGTKVVTTCEDTRARLYSTDPIDVLHTYWGHVGGVYSGCFSPNDEKIATAGKDGIIRLWDTKKDSYLLLESISGHTGLINNMEYSKDGYSLITSGIDNTICLWDPALGFQMKKMAGHSDTITSLHYYKDGNYLISASIDDSVKIWNLNSGKSILNINNQLPVYSVVASDDGSKIFIATSDSSVKVRDSKGILQKTIKNSAPVRALAYSNSNNTLITGDDIGNLNIYNLISYSVTKTYKINGKITKLILASNSDNLYALTSDNSLFEIIISGSKITDITNGSKIIDMAVSSGRIVEVCDGGILKIFLQSDLKLHGSYKYNLGYPNRVTFNADATTISVGGWGVNNIKIIETGKILAANEPVSIPKNFVLFQNYPNPFNPSTIVKFALGSKSNVTFKVYNILGELVHKRDIDNCEAGEHNISWNPGNISGGIYFYVLNNGMQNLMGKMLYLK